ncbi:unnamed protein product, partial [Didymodactylos carnosus]
MAHLGLGPDTGLIAAVQIGVVYIWRHGITGVVNRFSSVKYLNECPVQPNLPVYLLVVGSMGLVRVLNLLWKQFRRRRMRKNEGIELDQEEEPDIGNGSGFTDAILNLFL